MRRSASVLVALPLFACGVSVEDRQGEPTAPSVLVRGAETTTQDRADWEPLLEARRVDYSAALRTAALRLVGELPTLLEVHFVADAEDPQAAYEAMVDAYLDDPRLAGELVSFFRDTFKMGGTDRMDGPAVFAAQLAMQDRPFTDLLTAAAGTCPTFDPASGTFTPADCDNGVAQTVGVLTSPAVMEQFVSNLAFRRARWVQETFACAPFPAEVTREQAVGDLGAPYTAPWDWDSIAGFDNGGRIDFLDTSSVICANCHATLNHLAPLFARFDAAGLWSDDIAVTLPLEELPFAVLEDWLPAGRQQTAWRYGVPTPDLPALGAALAADPDVAACTVARAWNFALGRGDVIAADAEVPREVIAPIVDRFVADGLRFRDALRRVLTSDDFVRFPDEVAALADGLGTHGPPDVMARLHGCPKMKVATLGRVLASRGVDLSAASPTSAGALWRNGDQALGAAQYAARVPESLELTTASASRLFDIFVQAAPEMIAALPQRPECAVGGHETSLFDEAGHCTADGIACLTGLPATPVHLELCNETVARASTPEAGQRLAAAVLAAAAHTCE